MGNMGEEDQEIQTASHKISHRDVMYSMGTKVSNIILQI